jgi:hypothetical protein
MLLSYVQVGGWRVDYQILTFAAVECAGRIPVTYSRLLLHCCRLVGGAWTNTTLRLPT